MPNEEPEDKPLQAAAVSQYNRVEHLFKME